MILKKIKRMVNIDKIYKKIRIKSILRHFATTNNFLKLWLKIKN